MDAAGLIKYAVGTLAVGHIAHQCYAGHQKNGGQQTGQCADDKFFHVVSPSVLGAWPFISSRFMRRRSTSAEAACREDSFSFKYSVR